VCGVYDENGRLQADGVLKVSNLKRLSVTAIVLGEAGRFDGPRISSEGGTGGAPTAPPTLEIDVIRLSGGARSQVSISTMVSGFGVELDRQFLHFSLEIPIDRRQKQANIEQYLDWLGEESRKEGRGGDFAHLTKDRAAVVSSFERMYVENQVGEFGLTRSYSARRAGFWQGLVKAPGLRIAVESRGSFFDQLKK
jgi:hypothetical protein